MRIFGLEKLLIILNFYELPKPSKSGQIKIKASMN